MRMRLAVLCRSEIDPELSRNQPGLDPNVSDAKRQRIVLGANPRNRSRIRIARESLEEYFSDSIVESSVVNTHPSSATPESE